MELIYTDDEPSILADLVLDDAWISILADLSLKEIALTRRVCKKWCDEGKKRLTLYRIGFDRNGWSHWREDKSPIYGWGMKICVDSRGTVRGMNKNNADHSSVAKEKVYSGVRVQGVFSLNVVFPETDQLNTYTGSIVEEEGKCTFRGTFELIRSCGHRRVGDGGTMEGVVLEA